MILNFYMLFKQMNHRNSLGFTFFLRIFMPWIVYGLLASGGWWIFLGRWLEFWGSFNRGKWWKFCRSSNLYQFVVEGFHIQKSILSLEMRKPFVNGIDPIWSCFKTPKIVCGKTSRWVLPSSSVFSFLFRLLLFFVRMLRQEVKYQIAYFELLPVICQSAGMWCSPVHWKKLSARGD